MKLKGIIPPIITPFGDNQEIDENALREHIEFLINTKVHGIFVLGSTGEFAYLSEAEKKRVIEITVDQIKGKIPLIVGISSASTKISIELGKYAEKVGATAVMAALPTYFPLEKRNIEMYYQEIAVSVELPLYAYNFPLTTRINLTPKFVAKLAEQNILAGIKETVTDITHIEQMIKSTPDNFCVLCGTELLLLKGLKAGVAGAIVGMGNCFPGLLVQLWDAFMNKQEDILQNLWADFSQIFTFLNQPMDYLPSLAKEILVLMGKNINPQVRSPLRTIKQRIKENLKGISLIKSNSP